MSDALDLLSFVDAGVSPFHAVAEMARRLEGAGFSGLDEREAWDLAPGDRRYVVRDGGSVAAFVVGRAEPARAGFRLVGAHTDSPTYKVRPQPNALRAGQRVVGVETYGGPLAHTWLDRDLTLAGRLAVQGDDGAIDMVLVHLPGAWLRIPSLAIHLSREVREEGLRLNPQQHLVPLWGPASGPELIPAIAEHAGVTAITDLPDGAAHTAVFAANDHEEVGSRSAEGAAGPFLEDVLARIVAVCGGDGQGVARAAARSRLVSADMAHAVHPNYADRHELGHQPRLGGGPVIKHNANQSYASDAGTAAWFAARCAEVGIRPQSFVTRGDLPCGSTIGPLTATRLGIPTVDVGNPMLSMHSVREQAAAADVAPMIAALGAHLGSDAPT